MNAAELQTMILKHDWAAVDSAAQVGAIALPVLSEDLKHSDELVRSLAVDCIVAVGGAAAPDLLISALGDANEQVRAGAVNGLHERLPAGRETKLLEIWNHSRDLYVRKQIPLVLGRLNTTNTIASLRQLQSRTLPAEVQDAFTSSLAKLGDGDARKQFATMLRDAHGERIKEVIDLVKYVDQHWIIPDLRPVLDRREMAVDLSTHATTCIRRGCDLAVDEVLRLSKAKFSFQPTPIGQYTETQIAEVIHFVQIQPR
ncbi:MAG TPA: hypothetical protein VNZ64_09565 [Candidatus Acidoferrum sp.]|nr:hypothetical protein [Candidatus Acidoferrum sp.]